MNFKMLWWYVSVGTICFLAVGCQTQRSEPAGSRDLYRLPGHSFLSAESLDAGLEAPGIQMQVGQTITVVVPHVELPGGPVLSVFSQDLDVVMQEEIDGSFFNGTTLVANHPGRVKVYYGDALEAYIWEDDADGELLASRTLSPRASSWDGMAGIFETGNWFWVDVLGAP